MTIFMKLIFSALMVFNLYLFATIGDTAKADIIHQSELIPSRISKVIEMVSASIQEGPKHKHNLEVY
uniref:Uncharacterized protein n=1 Tax=viral metagenome TaxID=1070528 RepID=A0A6M3X648_9ZZZZ